MSKGTYWLLAFVAVLSLAGCITVPPLGAGGWVLVVVLYMMAKKQEDLEARLDERDYERRGTYDYDDEPMPPSEPAPPKRAPKPKAPETPTKRVGMAGSVTTFKCSNCGLENDSLLKSCERCQTPLNPQPVKLHLPALAKMLADKKPTDDG